VEEVKGGLIRSQAYITEPGTLNCKILIHAILTNGKFQN